MIVNECGGVLFCKKDTLGLNLFHFFAEDFLLLTNKLVSPLSFAILLLSQNVYLFHFHVSWLQVATLVTVFQEIREFLFGGSIGSGDSGGKLVWLVGSGGSGVWVVRLVRKIWKDCLGWLGWIGVFLVRMHGLGGFRTVPLVSSFNFYSVVE